MSVTSLLTFHRLSFISQLMTLWEISWTHSRTSHFSLFVAAAVLDLHEADIVSPARQSDDMLVFFAELVERTSCYDAIQRARLVRTNEKERNKVMRGNRRAIWS